MLASRPTLTKPILFSLELIVEYPFVYNVFAIKDFTFDGRRINLSNLFYSAIFPFVGYRQSLCRSGLFHPNNIQLKPNIIMSQIVLSSVREAGPLGVLHLPRSWQKALEAAGKIDGYPGTEPVTTPWSLTDWP